MPTDVLAPASSPSGVDAFLSSTLAAHKPKETTSPAPANEPPHAGTPKPVSPDPTPSAIPPASSSATAEPASPVSPAPSGEDKKSDAPSDPAAIAKQLSEQTRANKKLGKSNIELLKKNQELAKEVQALRTKVDPSYAPPAGPTPEQEREQAAYLAREAASRKIAEEKYGADTIQTRIYATTKNGDAEESEYLQLIQQKPWLHHRVLTSDLPVLEAIAVLEEEAVFRQFGTTTGSVLENVEKTIKDKLWKEWTAHTKATPQDTTGKPVSTLGQARGETGQTETRPQPKFDLHSFNRYIP